MDIINNGVNIKVVNGTIERHIFKNVIREISVVKTDTVKIDIGQGINNIFIKYSDVVNPVTANVAALRDALDAMCQSGEVGAELLQIKGGIDTLNTSMNSLNGKILSEPLAVDESTPNTVYRGFAPVGTLSSAAAWAIQQVVIAGDVTTRKWASGNQNFTNVWDNRATLTYS